MSTPAPELARLDLIGLIRDSLRPEFLAPLIIPGEQHNTIFLANKCLVRECRTQTGGQLLCTTHRARYASDGGGADVQIWAASAPPLHTGNAPMVGCMVAGCRRSGRLCATHRAQWAKQHGALSKDAWAQLQPAVIDDGPIRWCLVEGCTLQAESGPQLCLSHRSRWHLRGRPHVDQFVVHCRTYGLPRFDLRTLTKRLRLEVAFGLQARADDGAVKTFPWMVAQALRELDRHQVVSVLDFPEGYWAGTASRSRAPGRQFLAFTRDRIEDLIAAHDGVEEWDRDRWLLRRIPVLRDGEMATFDFTAIPQRWLRELVKQFVRERAVRNLAQRTLGNDVWALTQFATFLDQVARHSTDASVITRARLEDYLAHQTATGVSLSKRQRQSSVLSIFLLRLQRGDWTTRLPRTARLYTEDFPRREKHAPRFLTEFVMAQIEAPQNLNRLPIETRLITKILIGTGLRIIDVCRLRLDCVRTDADSGHYLHYRNKKMKRDAAVPIASELADEILGWAARSARQFPDGTYLFPRRIGNQHGRDPRSTASYRTAISKWLARIELRDEAGQPVTVTAHRFRHTYGTRLINAEVPEEVVRRLLDHSSVEMVQTYAKIHDITVRKAWEKAQKVNAHGEPVTVDAASPLADAEWIKHNLAKARMSLPNGYCGLAVTRNCPHANACLVCPLFVTTSEFLPQHHEQLANTRKLIATANNDGQFRMVEMNRQVETNLVRIIDTLEHRHGEPDD